MEYLPFIQATYNIKRTSYGFLDLENVQTGLDHLDKIRYEHRFCDALVYLIKKQVNNADQNAIVMNAAIAINLNKIDLKQ